MPAIASGAASSSKTRKEEKRTHAAALSAGDRGASKKDLCSAVPGASRSAKVGDSEVPAEPVTGFWKNQIAMRDWYNKPNVQFFIAALIIINFMTNILEKELDPSGEKYKKTWRVLEHAFNAVFLIELLINMYAHWRKMFWASSWNVFDFIVVCVGCVGFVVELAGPLKLLRTLRAFRVFRLFKRIKSLNMIIVMIVSAIPGVSNAFLVMVLCISIYALIGVEFYYQFGTDNATELGFPEDPDSPQCGYANVEGVMVSSVSARQICYGSEYYGTFTRAWFSLFQVLTGESWAEVVARPIIFGWEDYGPVSVFISALYFISFVLVNSFILFNVFVAVLLDKVVSGGEEDEGAEGAEGADVALEFALSQQEKQEKEEGLESAAKSATKSSTTGGEEAEAAAQQHEAGSPASSTPRGEPHAKMSTAQMLEKMLQLQYGMQAQAAGLAHEQAAMRIGHDAALGRLANLEAAVGAHHPNGDNGDGSLVRVLPDLGDQR